MHRTLKLITALIASAMFISPEFTAQGQAQEQTQAQAQVQTQAQTQAQDWNDPEKISCGKEQPHAWFFNFKDVESARKVLPEYSAYWQSLDGDWFFHWSPDPESRPKDFYKADFDVTGWDKIPVPSNWNVIGIGKDGSQKYGKPVYVNQKVIFHHKVAVDDWRGGVMREPDRKWTTYKHRNEIGSYRRTFSVPDDWKGREVFINFDGVDSFFYLWINGEYAGFSKNSRNLASFNITKYLKAGENMVAAEVYRNSDGSFLEAQDMFRLPGIFRTVSLTSVPKTQIRDLRAIPSLDDSYTNGTLNISAEVRNLGKKAAHGYTIEYSLYRNELYADDTFLVPGVGGKAKVASVKAGASGTVEYSFSIEKPALWSAEQPNRYTLVAQLKNASGKVVETVSTIVGFRQVEIKGDFWYLNGRKIKLKGVNRHETDPAFGHAITRELMEQDVFIMKRHNINHVRGSHYPDAPYWYHLCNKYGIMLEDEANIESHEYYYGDASLSHPKEWEAAHVDRILAMVKADINHPSVVIWSLGNEAGPGHNFVVAYDSLKRVDKSRPVQYERNNDIVDMGSNQYPSVDWVKYCASGKAEVKYPFHISEYAHSMGNAMGNLADYWEAIESSDYICGGAIWDWIDQALWNYTADGRKYLAYGGDFGDFPNDGQFVMNGIMFADRTPKPQMTEVKKVYQYITVSESDKSKGEFEVFNKNFFIDLSYVDLKWAIFSEGAPVKDGSCPVGALAPRGKMKVTVPVAGLDPEKENILEFHFVQKEDYAWAGKGYPVASEQFVLNTPERPAIAEIAGTDSVAASEEGDFVKISGAGFNAVFDNQTGTIHSLEYDGKKIFSEGDGPQLNAFRAFTNNDGWAYEKWFANGLHNLKHKATSCKMEKVGNTVRLDYTVLSQAPCGASISGGTSSGKNRVQEIDEKPFGELDLRFVTNQTWTIYPDGSIELEAAINSNEPEFNLGKLGYIMKVPSKFDQFSYYGRGPVGNYPDRKTGSFIGLYENTVDGEFEHFPKPQEMSNHEDVRWCALTDEAGDGILIVAGNVMSASVNRWSPMQLTLAGHIHQLPEPGASNYLCIDKGVTGLGGNSCGPAPIERDRVKAGPQTFSFLIRKPAGNPSGRAYVSGK